MDQAPSTPSVEIQREICDRLRVGIPIRFAAMAAHVSVVRVQHWYEAGDRDRGLGYMDTPLARFANAVDEADATYVASAIARIRQHGATDWKAEAWLLERRHPLQFASVRGLVQRSPSGEEAIVDGESGDGPPRGGRTIVVIGAPDDEPPPPSSSTNGNGSGHG